MKVKELFENVIKGGISVKPYGVPYSGDLDLKTIKDGKLPFDYSNDILNGDLEIDGDYKLTSLEGCPKIVNGIFWIESKKLKNLKSSPNEVNSFFCEIPTLTSLEGAPLRVRIGNGDSSDGTVSLKVCEELTSLTGIGRDYFQQIDKAIVLPNTIKESMLGILKIKNLQEIRNFNLTGDLENSARIINKYLDSGRNINKCKSELIEAGLEEYAQL